MAKLTHGVELELQRNIDALQFRMQEAIDTVQGLEPKLDRLRTRLASVEDYVATTLEGSVKKSGDMINNNIQGAGNLHQMIAVMIKAVLEGTSHVAVAQEKSVQLAKQNSDGSNQWAQELARAASLTNAINTQLVRT